MASSMVSQTFVVEICTVVREQRLPMTYVKGKTWMAHRGDTPQPERGETIAIAPTALITQLLQLTPELVAAGKGVSFRGDVYVIDAGTLAQLREDAELQRKGVRWLKPDPEPQPVAEAVAS